SRGWNRTTRDFAYGLCEHRDRRRQGVLIAQELIRGRAHPSQTILVVHQALECDIETVEGHTREMLSWNQGLEAERVLAEQHAAVDHRSDRPLPLEIAEFAAMDVHQELGVSEHLPLSGA